MASINYCVADQQSGSGKIKWGWCEHISWI